MKVKVAVFLLKASVWLSGLQRVIIKVNKRVIVKREGKLKNYVLRFLFLICWHMHRLNSYLVRKAISITNKTFGINQVG